MGWLRGACESERASDCLMSIELVDAVVVRVLLACSLVHLQSPNHNNNPINPL